MQFSLPNFGPPVKPENRVKGGITTRAAARRMARIKEARDALAHIPAPGETFHGIMLGTFDLAHMYGVFLEQLGTAQEVYLATLSLSSKNVAEMTSWLDSGQVEKLSLLTSDFFRRHDRKIFNGLLAEFTKRGQRVAAARSHCKLGVFKFADGRQFVFESSANLRTNQNCEAYCLTNDTALAVWYAEWLEEMMVKHEVRESDSPGQD